MAIGSGTLANAATPPPDDPDIPTSAPVDCPDIIDMPRDYDPPTDSCTTSTTVDPGGKDTVVVVPVPEDTTGPTTTMDDGQPIAPITAIAEGAGGTLPPTGSSNSQTGMIALGLVVAGGLLTVAGIRRRPTA